MTRFGALLLSATALASCQASPLPQTGSTTLVQIDTGQVRGKPANGIVEFRGIPYAAAPVGELRFAPPAPAVAWRGIRDASRFAPVCPQGSSFQEDCLYLNVSVPDRRSNRKRPVMVWLHGGGLSAGTPNTYDASELVAKGDVIFVGVEFRVNVFGLFQLANHDGPGSPIFADQQAALRWVKRNIAAFGGDSDNITLFGESGGGVSTCAQIVSPGAHGLFQKAILQSGTCSVGWNKHFIARGVPGGSFFVPRAEVEAQSARMAKSLGCVFPRADDTMHCLRRLPAQKIAAAGAAFVSGAYGTPLVPIEPHRAVATGQYNQIPVLTGFNRDEGRAMVSGMLLSKTAVTASNYPEMVADAFEGHASEILGHYRPVDFTGRADFAWAAIVTDRMFACPQLRDAIAFSRRQPTYLYEFADPHGVGLVPFLPDMPSGASHSGELPLLFRLADGPISLVTGKKIARSEDQQSLSDLMILYWTNFARRGDPNMSGLPIWPRLNSGPTETAIRLAPGSSQATNDLSRFHQCRFWNARSIDAAR